MTTDDALDAFAAVFTTLGALHREAPDQEVLEAVRAMNAEWPLPARGATGEGLEGWRSSASKGETAEQVERDHDRLYGDSAVALVPPYESVHRGSEGLVFDTQTLQVRAAYAELGLRAPALGREPDDHIGLELEFLSQACLHRLDLMEAGDDAGAAQLLEAARAFTTEHLEMWAPAFLDAVHSRAKTDFMAGLARLTTGALENFSTEILRKSSSLE